MRRFELWMEGYRATCEHDTARFLGVFEAETFDDAYMIYAKQKNLPDYDIKKKTDWGRRIFDNEADARRSFG